MILSLLIRVLYMLSCCPDIAQNDAYGIAVIFNNFIEKFKLSIDHRLASYDSIQVVAHKFDLLFQFFVHLSYLLFIFTFRHNLII